MTDDSRDQAEPSLYRLVSALLDRRSLLTRSAVVSVILVVALGLLMREYDARARISVQQQGGSLSALAGLAAQVGLPVGAQGEGDSPLYFAQLLRSRDVLDSLSQLRFSLDGADTNLVSLRDILEIDKDLEQREARIEAIEEMKGRVSTSADVTTGLVAIRVRMPTPALAERVLDSLLSVAEHSHRRRKVSVAAAERSFVEERFRNATIELRSSQDSLERFLEANRSFRESARLSLIAQNLQRAVELRQAVVVSLSQALETARIEEVRNTPIFTTIESPTNTAEPSAKLLYLLALGMLLGAVVGTTLLLFRGLLDHRSAQAPDEIIELRARVKEFVRDPFQLRRG